MDTSFGPDNITFTNMTTSKVPLPRGHRTAPKAESHAEASAGGHFSRSVKLRASFPVTALRIPRAGDGSGRQGLA
jgi:hypothetical protein